eukprot:6459842-Amphidinium_carterae.3
MSVVWLAHSASRIRVNKRRHRADVDAEDEQFGRSLFALAKVIVGDVFDGPLTAWPASVWQQYDEYEQLSDGFAIHLQAVFFLNEAIPVHAVLSDDGLISSNPRFNQPIFLPSLQGHDVGLDVAMGRLQRTEASLQQVLTRWCPDLLCENKLPIIPALTPTPSLVQPLRDGNVNALLALARWVRYIPSTWTSHMRSPSKEWICAKHHEAAIVSKPITADGLADFLQAVRETWHDACASQAGAVED